MNARENVTFAKEFFSLNGRYLIAPSSTAKDLAIDASCLLEGVIKTLQAIIDGLSNTGSEMTANMQRQVPGMLFGLLYQLEMVQSITESLEDSSFADRASTEMRHD